MSFASLLGLIPWPVGSGCSGLCRWRTQSLAPEWAILINASSGIRQSTKLLVNSRCSLVRPPKLVVVVYFPRQTQHFVGTPPPCKQIFFSNNVATKLRNWAKTAQPKAIEFECTHHSIRWTHVMAVQNYAVKKGANKSITNIKELYINIYYNLHMYKS